jgi:hypothetical protein
MNAIPFVIDKSLMAGLRHSLELFRRALPHFWILGWEPL